MRKITILVTSDVHGYVMPTDFASSNTQPYGMAKVATYIRQKRAEGPVLLIDNGDFIQGSPMTYFQNAFQFSQIDPMIQLANALQYDAAVIGNHEFNYGLPTLHRALQHAHYPVVTANILQADGSYFTKPYTILERAGMVIGIIGVTTQSIPVWEKAEHIEGLQFVSAFDTTKYWVEQLRKEHAVDLLIVSYHGGFEADLETGEILEASGENEGYRICKEIDGIDVFITGHQHRTIATTLFGKSIIQPGSKGTYVGAIEVSIEELPNGEQHVHHKPQLHKIKETTAVDEDIAALIQPVHRATEAWLDQPIGTLETDVTIADATKARLRKHPYVAFINQVQMDVSGAPISCTSLFNNTCRGLQREVRMRDIVTNYIFPNTLKVLQLTGQEIIDALEQNATYFTLQDGYPVVSSTFLHPKEQHYNYDMWDGIEYTIDLRKPEGQRVDHVTFANHPLDREQTYEVVMNNYRATGAGHFDAFANAPVIHEIQTDMTEILANYIMQHPTITIDAHENWKIVY